METIKTVLENLATRHMLCFRLKGLIYVRTFCYDSFQSSKELFLNMLEFAGCLSKNPDIYCYYFLWRLAENFEQKQPVMVRILLAVAYSKPLF